MSTAIKELNSWLGLKHVVSLTDVHTSNSCENTNKQIIAHLSALCNDLRVKDKWSDLKIIALHFNGSVSSEGGMEPFKALFGSADDTYYALGISVNIRLCIGAVEGDQRSTPGGYCVKEGRPNLGA
jgi:hypothetical protein